MPGRTALTMDGCNPECKFGIAIDELKSEQATTGNAVREMRDIAERNSNHAVVEETRDRLMQLEIDYEGAFVLEAVRKNCQQSCEVEHILGRPNFGTAIISKITSLKNQ